MNLLYCDAAGVVVVIHSDDQVFVPMENYPNVVRIIPYDLPLDLLEKLGDPPPPPPSQNPDRRPYVQPEPTTDILKMYASQCRFVKEVSGFEFVSARGVVPIWTDRLSYNYICGLARYADSINKTNIIHYTQGQITYDITAQECITLFLNYTEKMQRCRNAEANCLLDLNGATPSMTSYEAIDEMFIGVTKDFKEAKRPLLRNAK